MTFTIRHENTLLGTANERGKYDTELEAVVRAKELAASSRKFVEAALALIRWMQKYLDDEGEKRSHPCFTRSKLRIVETALESGTLRPWTKE